jgi:hypothetical protein
MLYLEKLIHGTRGEDNSMGREDKIQQVAELLQQTDLAHHSYEKKVLKGDQDIDWPEWFAEYLIGHGFDLLMEDRLATELLVSFLKKSRADHRACGSNLSWEKFTARRIVEKLA